MYIRFSCITGQNWFGPLLLEFKMGGKGHQALLHLTFDRWCPQTWTQSLPQPPASQQHDDAAMQVSCFSFLSFFLNLALSGNHPYEDVNKTAIILRKI
jgi:hypothetical protein